MDASVRRFPSRLLIAYGVAPLVRLGYLTEVEGRWLVEHRYKQRAAELARMDGAD